LPWARVPCSRSREHAVARHRPPQADAPAWARRRADGTRDRARSFLRVTILAREVAIVNGPRSARQKAPNSMQGRPRIAPSWLAASLCVTRCWNYYVLARNPSARVLRRKPQEPVGGVRATQRPIKAYAQLRGPFSNPLLGATRKSVIPAAVTPLFKTTSVEMSKAPPSPSGADFLGARKKSRPTLCRCP